MYLVKNFGIICFLILSVVAGILILDKYIVDTIDAKNYNKRNQYNVKSTYERYIKERAIIQKNSGECELINNKLKCIYLKGCIWKNMQCLYWGNIIYKNDVGSFIIETSENSSFSKFSFSIQENFLGLLPLPINYYSGYINHKNNGTELNYKTYETMIPVNPECWRKEIQLTDRNITVSMKNNLRKYSRCLWLIKIEEEKYPLSTNKYNFSMLIQNNELYKASIMNFKCSPEFPSLECIEDLKHKIPNYECLIFEPFEKSYYILENDSFSIEEEIKYKVIEIEYFGNLNENNFTFSFSPIYTNQNQRDKAQRNLKGSLLKNPFPLFCRQNCLQIYCTISLIYLIFGIWLNHLNTYSKKSVLTKSKPKQTRKCIESKPANKVNKPVISQRKIEESKIDKTIRNKEKEVKENRSLSNIKNKDKNGNHSPKIQDIRKAEETKQQKVIKPTKNQQIQKKETTKMKNEIKKFIPNLKSFECSICSTLLNLIPGKILKLPCGHYYHENCAEKKFIPNTNLVCFSCRRPFSENEIMLVNQSYLNDLGKMFSNDNHYFLNVNQKSSVPKIKQQQKESDIQSIVSQNPFSES